MLRWITVGVALGSLCLTLVSACSESQPRRNDDDDDGGSVGGAGGSGGSGQSTPGGPEVLEVLPSQTVLLEGQTISYTATVTDPDGLEDIVGGLLKNEDGTLFAPFVQLSGGTFTVDVSWSQLHTLAPINFDSSEQRSFVAEFSDTTQKVGTYNISLSLACNTEQNVPAIDGDCPPCEGCFQHLQSGMTSWVCEGASSMAYDQLEGCACAACNTECGLICGGTEDLGCFDCMLNFCDPQLNECVAN